MRMRESLDIVESAINSEIVDEVINFDKQFPENTEASDKTRRDLVTGAQKIKQIDSNVNLYVNNDYYFLMDIENNVIGFIKSEEQHIAEKTYINVTLIYIYPKYRGKSAWKPLLYSFKEEVKYPVIMDGAIFTGGKAIIKTIIRDRLMNVQALDKNTGLATKCNGIIDSDFDTCYLLEKVKFGYGKQYFTEGSAFTWYGLMDWPFT